MLEILKLKPDAFGLDISDFSLKIAKLKKKDKSLSLASFGEAKIDPGVVEGGKIQDEKKLIRIIKEAIPKVKGEKINTNYVIASLPEEKAFLEVIQMPKLTSEELKKAIYFEAENHIPLSIEDAYFDFQIVRPLHNHLDHSDILIIALPKETINSYVALLRGAGLRPQALEVESISIARSLVRGGVSPHPFLFIDFDENKTSLMFFSGYSLRFSRSISLSSREITKIISRELNMPFQEAEKLKIKFGLEKEYRLKIKNGIKTEVTPGKILKIATPFLNNLVVEIKKSIDYYQTHIHHEHLLPNGKGITKILLCGGGGNLKGLPEFLSLALKMPVELGNPWVNILKTPPREIPELPYEKSLAFTVALGLALRGIDN